MSPADHLKSFLACLIDESLTVLVSANWFG